MSSAHASQVKKSGHQNEHDFANLIGGHVNLGSHTDKKDVIDKQDRPHSVKAGKWWQIFLYGKTRLETNTIFQGLGDLAEIMIACIDAYPENYNQYKSDKKSAKTKLQPEMHRLLAELKKPRIFSAFLDKSLFDAGNAEYLSIYLGPAKDTKSKKVFHIFHINEVVNALAANLTLRNSKARNKKQWDDQKVVLVSKISDTNAGEIEDRHDSKSHYREMKFRLNSEKIFRILEKEISEQKRESNKIITYGIARNKFSL